MFVRHWCIQHLNYRDFVIAVGIFTIADYLARTTPGALNIDQDEFLKAREDAAVFTDKLLQVKGKRTASEFHRELGRLLWEHVGMTRSKEGLATALKRIPELRAAFWEDVNVPGSGSDLNQQLEKAGRVADFLEFSELMAKDALTREESCGAHFRVEYQTPEHEAKRDDANFRHVAAWEYRGEGEEPVLHKEPLTFENVELAVRNYK